MPGELLLRKRFVKILVQFPAQVLKIVDSMVIKPCGIGLEDPIPALGHGEKPAVIGTDKHIYLTGNGQFPLKATIAYSFCGRCKSINMKPQGDELFTCIWTACSERKVGDQTK